MDNPIIELRSVSVKKGGVHILKEIDIQFPSGSRNIIVGPSGAGKTTLLRLLNRMDDPSSGEILFNGKNIRKYPVIEIRRKVGMVFQIPVVLGKTVRDNLIIPHRLLDTGDPPDVMELERTLELSGLALEFMDRDAGRLSVGEKQRLNVARALINRPDVLLLDEPTSALDPTTSLRLLESIMELNKSLGITVIMVTHQTEHADFFGSGVIRLEDGRIAEEVRSLNFSSTSKERYGNT